jgi:type IV pilus assembly protein PilM
MAAPQTIWGIDMGRCALKAVKLRAAGDGKVELIAHDYIEHPKILSQPDANREELISNALEKFLSRNDLSKDKVVAAVPGQQTLARFTKLPPVQAKRIPDIVRYEADQQIPFDMDEVIWDYQIFQQEGLPDLEVGIFAMKRELIREHLLHLEQASIEPIAVQTTPLAVYNAAVFDGWLSSETTILLDIGAENTDLIIATPNNLWTRSIAIGGNNFTEALVKSFKLSFSKAESLKRTASTSKYARQVFQAMRPVFADLVQELQRSIGFYSSTHRDAEINKVVCVGSAFELPGLQKYLQQNLDLDVVRPESLNNLIESPASAAPQFAEHLPSFAVAYGLAIQGLDLSKVTSNLLPIELAKQMVWAKKKPSFAAAAACLFLAGGAVWFRQASDMSALRDSVTAQQPASAEAAWSVIQSGPTGLSHRASAQTVLAAGKKLKSTLSERMSEGQLEAEEMNTLLTHLRNKRVIPLVTQIVHEAVPQPAGALAGAQTAEQYRELVAAASPRPERGELFIDSMLMHFTDDLGTERDFSDGSFFPEDETDVVSTFFDGSEIKTGLLVRLTVSTPHKDNRRYVRETLMKNLRELGRKPGYGLYINRVYLMKEGQQFASKLGVTTPDDDSVVIGGAPPAAGGGPKGVGRFAPAGRGPARPTGRGPDIGGEIPGFDLDKAQVTDPVSGESRANDWIFDVVFEVLLEDLPEGFLDTPEIEGGEAGGESVIEPDAGGRREDR